MTEETIILIGRDTGNRAEVFETHAGRLADRAAVDRVETATYDSEPVQELRQQFRDVTADRVYAIPMCMAHNHDTTRGIPAALSHIPGDVTYCQPPGRTETMTEVIEQKASSLVSPERNVTLVLVGFGSNSRPDRRQMTEYHASRLRETTAYGEVESCYLLQNPAVECVRYNITNPIAVAVPLFLGRSEATAKRIPAKLELGRGGIEYASPLETHPRITDVLHAEFEKQRALDRPSTGRFEAELARSQRPVATDGDGQSRV